MTEQNEMENRRKRRWTFWRVLASLFLYLWVFLFIGAIIAGVLAFIVYDHVIQPGVPGMKIVITVPEGATGRDIGKLLADNGLIEYEGFFRLAMEIDGRNRPLRHGQYELPKGLSVLELLHRMQDGPPLSLNANKVQVTIPEGLTLAQAGQLFKNPQAFLEAASDPVLLGRLGLQTKTLEGFLMPNTYYFDAPPTERQVVERMVEQFEKVWKQLSSSIPGAAQFDKLSVVTIASLVEEEAKVADERSMVAAVLYNRLEKKMPLQMDSTLQYVLGKYGERLLYTDREVDSPYNTYKNAGLPPGPISSPGEDCLRAALNPAPVDYLFFVSNADGKTHTFSSTMAEHERAVARFRRDIAPQRREQQQQAPDSVSATVSTESAPRKSTGPAMPNP